MRAFQDQGLIKAVGMRGPHRFATDCLTVPKDQREDKYARFRSLFSRIRPSYLAVRFNALTPPPPPGHDDIFAFAAAHEASVLINKPLAQGLLTPQALAIIHDGLQPMRARFGASPADLAPVMLSYCLHRASNAAVLAGFTTPAQVTQNLTPAR
jgi:methylglyoxal reductase